MQTVTPSVHLSVDAMQQWQRRLAIARAAAVREAIHRAERRRLNRMTLIGALLLALIAVLLAGCAP